MWVWHGWVEFMFTQLALSFSRPLWHFYDGTSCSARAIHLIISAAPDLGCVFSDSKNTPRRRTFFVFVSLSDRGEGSPQRWGFPSVWPRRKGVRCIDLACDTGAPQPLEGRGGPVLLLEASVSVGTKYRGVKGDRLTPNTGLTGG